jgi:glyoxylase-like metal-dependent hydrolase (beta-lactamase superfamily II)
MVIRQLFDRETSTYTYLVADPSTRLAVLIDPVREHVERDLGLIAELGLELRYVLETHVHADHITSAGALRERTGALTCASTLGAPCIDGRLVDGDRLSLGELAISVLGTPGHTDDGLAFVIGNAVFTGDTLFVRGCGRADFQNGDAGQLYDSIQKLFALPPSTIVYPGHDYRGFTSSTIDEEQRYNPRIAGRTREEFIALMGSLELAPPARIAEAVPANRACGRPAADDQLTAPRP